MRFFARSAAVVALAFALGLAAVRAAGASTLPAAPTPAESFDVGTLHVDRYGSGPRTLILIPGLSCGPWEWYGTIAHEAPNSTIYALTLPGFDGLAASKQKPLIAAFVTNFAALLDARKIVKPTVVGHSLGGTLAIILGETYPSRLHAIVAVDGLPVFPTMSTFSAAQRMAGAMQMAEPLVNLTPAQFLAGNEQFMSSFGIADATLVEPTAQLLSESDPAAAASWLMEDVSGDWRPALREVTIPLVEIMPYYAPDHVAPPLNFSQDQTQAFYASLLAGAPKLTILAIPGARHFAMLDQPALFATALDQALAL
jgi:pimeloyl-ACP methyl ester carboxylesterase